MFFVHDNSEFSCNNFDELKGFLQEREKGASWLTDEDGVSADSIRFQPVFAEPICVPAEVNKLKQSTTVKFSASEDAYADTMFAPDAGYEGSSQMVFVKGGLYPMGTSAIKGSIDRAGLKAEGFEKLKKFSPQSLSDVLNLCMKASSGSLCILVQDEKVRAINSGRYAICPATFVADETEKWMQTERPDAKFVAAYANHDFINWTLDLSSYSNEVLGNFQALATSGFSPALTVQLSHTGSSSVSLKPSLLKGNILFPIGDPINCPHIGSGSASERTEQVKQTVKDNFKMIFPNLQKAAESVEKLDSVIIKNAYSAVIGVMRDLKVPKVQGMEAAEQFGSMYPGRATAYDCLGAIIDAFSCVMRDFPNNERKQLEMAEIVKRASVVKWAEKDIPGQTW